MPDLPVQIWSWANTMTLAPATPNWNGPKEFSQALVSLREKDGPPHLPLWGIQTPAGWGVDTPVDVLDRGMDINSQWSETDLIKEPEQRRKEGWYVFSDSPTWADCNTPLHMAMSADSIDTATMLLLRGANINIYNARGQTMLHRAVYGRQTKWVEFLLQHGVNMDLPTIPSSVSCWLDYAPFFKKSEPGGQLPLTRAILNQNILIINMLLDQGADPNHPVLGWWPLELAVLSRDCEIVRVLLSKGAKLPSPEICAIDIGSSNTNDKENEESQLPELEEIAKRLIASSKCLPDPEAREVFNKIIKSKRISRLLEDRMVAVEQKASDLVTSFFDILSHTACTLNPHRPQLQHCDRCLELQSGPAFRGDSQDWTWGCLEKLIQSASGGCPVCNLLLDAVKYPKCGKGKPLNNEDAVMLNAYGGRWELKCGGRSATIELRPIFDNLMKHKESDVTSNATTGQDTGSPRAFEMARRWLEHCESAHSNINGGDSHTSFECPDPPTEQTLLPTRVIFVGEEGGLPRVLEGNGLRAPYCALSYCWGNAQSVVSTKASISSHLERLTMEALPKTIREAIFAARQLGFQYIWIDALCIIQDDKEDWEREAANMRDIYYNARLVLCASDSDGCDGGLFRPRKEELISPVQLTVPIPSNTFPGKTCMYAFPSRASGAPREDSPVDCRAWTLQEKILSPRILFFGAGILRWECLTVKASETDPDGMLEASRGQLVGITCRDRRVLQARPLYKRQGGSLSAMTAADGAKQREYEASLPYEAWEKMVAEYSSRAVTNPTDRIPAIIGLGHRLEKTLGDKFIAGVWKETLSLRSLCWQTTHAGHPIIHYPSWSWASITSPVRYSMIPTKDVRNGLVTWHTGLPEYDVEAHGVQHIVQGSITIRGTTKPVAQNLVQRSRWYGYSNVDEVFFDCDQETLVGVQYLIMATIKSYENRLPRVVCMLLKPVEGTKSNWRRIGICSFEDKEDFWVNLERDRMICII